MDEIEQLAFSLRECQKHGAEAAVHVIIGGDPVWTGPLTREALGEIVRDLGELIREFDATQARIKAEQN